ncbi:hypothetical protein [Halocola ammonii]
MRIIFTALLSFSFALIATSQTDWETVDLSEELKGKFKIKNSSAKSLKKNKTFVNDYTISQATKMKGSESTAETAVFSEVTLGGLENEPYQEMVNEMYQHLITELEQAGLEITNGEEVVNSDYAQKRAQKNKSNESIGNIGVDTSWEGEKKITEGTMPGYAAVAVTTDLSFRPENKIIYYTSSLLKAGNFYMKLAGKEDYNLLNIHFYVTFANFDGGRGYKDIKLETEPVLSVAVQVQLITPNGAFNEVYYKENAWGSDQWSKEIERTKDNKSSAEFLGLARSADFLISADQSLFLSELKQIIKAYQRDIASGIREEIE